MGDVVGVNELPGKVSEGAEGDLRRRARSAGCSSSNCRYSDACSSFPAHAEAAADALCAEKSSGFARKSRPCESCTESKERVPHSRKRSM